MGTDTIKASSNCAQRLAQKTHFAYFFRKLELSLSRELSVGYIGGSKENGLQEGSEEIMERKACGGGAEESKEGRVDEGEEEHVMGQIDEIGRVANHGRKAARCS